MSDTPAIACRQLYGEVWAAPIVQPAAKYGLSKVGLSTACDRHSIPRPGSGHWAKKQFGKADPQPPLPPVDALALETVALVHLARVLLEV